MGMQDEGFIYSHTGETMGTGIDKVEIETDYDKKGKTVRGKSRMFFFSTLVKCLWQINMKQNNSDKKGIIAGVVMRFKKQM